MANTIVQQCDWQFWNTKIGLKKCAEFAQNLRKWWVEFSSFFGAEFWQRYLYLCCWYSASRRLRSRSWGDIPVGWSRRSLRRHSRPASSETPGPRLYRHLKAHNVGGRAVTQTAGAKLLACQQASTPVAGSNRPRFTSQRARGIAEAMTSLYKYTKSIYSDHHLHTKQSNDFPFFSIFEVVCNMHWCVFKL